MGMFTADEAAKEEKRSRSTKIARVDKAIKRTLLKRFITLNKSLSIKEYRDIARKYYSETNYKEAHSIINVALVYHPNNIDLSVEQAKIFMLEKRWLSAEKQLEKIIHKHKYRPSLVPDVVWLKLIGVLVQQKKISEAIVIVRKGLRFKRGSNALILEHARLSILNNDWRKASGQWRNIYLINKNNSEEVLYNLSRSLLFCNKLEESNKIIKKGLTLYPDSPRLLAVRAERYQIVGRWSLALSVWRHLIEILGPNPNENINLLQEARFNESVIKRLINIKRFRADIAKHNTSGGIRRRIAVVTAVTDDYDVLKPPEIIDDRIDYFAFSNILLNDYGIFKQQPLPYLKLDAPRAIRYVKTHPHTLFKEYDAVVWVDTSIMIVGDIVPLVNRFLESGMAVGSGVHPHRRSIYEEFVAASERNKADPKIMKKQVDYYWRKGFRHNDLSENTLLMFNINNRKLAPAMETWWKQICRFSARDQLSFNYSLKMNNVKWFALTKPPKDIHHHPLFVIIPHSTTLLSLLALTKRINAK